jgi:AcrR family transcriptional regulator
VSEDGRAAVGQVHKPAPVRRQEIVDATVRVMRRKGLLQTTSRDVAAEAGTSSGLLAHYFESHDHLLVCAFEQVAERDLARMRALLQAEPDVVARLRVLLEEFSPAEHAWQYRVWIDVWGAAAQSEALRRSSRRLNLRWVALVTEVFRTGAGDGSFRTPQPDASAWRLLALMDGLSVQLVAGQTDADRTVLLGWVREAAAAEAGIAVEVLTPPSG